MPDDQELLKFTPRELAETQLRELQKELRFAVHEPTVDLCVQKLKSGEFSIPSYQRNLTWDEDRMSKFIESMLIGLPIPFIFGVAEESKDDRIAIIDGRQRLGTLAKFYDNELPLKNLEKLYNLEGFRYRDLSDLQQRRFRNRPIRIVVLDGADPSTQFDMFERLNTTGKIPTRAEIRRGAFPGPFTDLVIQLAKNEKFINLTPMNEPLVELREREELVLRFFCYKMQYKQFQHSVTQILDGFMREENERCLQNPKLLKQHEAAFDAVCEFAISNLPQGVFARKDRLQTPRVRFEALAVGIALALQENTSMKRAAMDWVYSKEFEELTTTSASNSRPKLVKRIEFARDQILSTAHE